MLPKCSILCSSDEQEQKAIKANVRNENVDFAIFVLIPTKPAFAETAPFRRSSVANAVPIKIQSILYSAVSGVRNLDGIKVDNCGFQLRLSVTRSTKL
mgnify:CR=1 FL=1